MTFRPKSVFLCAAAVCFLMFRAASSAHVVRGIPRVTIADYDDGRPSETYLTMSTASTETAGAGNDGPKTFVLDRRVRSTPEYNRLLAASNAHIAVDVSYESEQETPATRQQIRVVSVENKDDASAEAILSEPHKMMRTPRDEAEDNGGDAENMRLLVLILSMKGLDDPTCTRAKAERTFWDGPENIASFLARATHGHVTLARNSSGARSDVAGPFHLDRVSTAWCDTDTWMDAGIAAAAAAGVPVWRYRYVVAVLPPNVPCSWLGLATVGCSSSGQCRLWVKACDSWATIAHEIGHNLGLRHAATQTHETDDYVEYGDPTSIMGNRWLYHNLGVDFSAPQMLSAGWLPQSQAVAVDESMGATAQRLAPSDRLPEECGGLPQLLVVEHPTSYYTYYASWRADPRLHSAGAILIHRSYSLLYAETELVATLRYAGEVYTDRASRMSLSVDEIGGDTVVVGVTWDCVVREPSLRLVVVAPARKASEDDADEPDEVLDAEMREDVVWEKDVDSTGQRNMFADAIAVGEAVRYELLVTNMDSGVCLPSLFSVGARGTRIEATVRGSDDKAYTMALAPGDTCAFPVAAAWDDDDDDDDEDNGGDVTDKDKGRLVLNVQRVNGNLTNATVEVSRASGVCRGQAPASHFGRFVNQTYSEDVDVISVRPGGSAPSNTVYTLDLLSTALQCTKEQSYDLHAEFTGSACPASSAVGVALKQASVMLERRKPVSVNLTVSVAVDAPLLLQDAGCRVRVTASALNNAKYTVLDVPLVVGLACPTAPTLVYTAPTALKVRTARWFSVSLSGLEKGHDGCVVNVSSVSKSLPAGYTLISSKQDITVRNATAAFRAIVGASDKVSGDSLQANVAVGSSHVDVSVTVDESDNACVRKRSYSRLSCFAGTVKPDEAAHATCSVSVQNLDSWGCTESKYSVKLDNLPDGYSLKDKSAVQKLAGPHTLAPGSSVSLSFSIKRSKFIPDLNEAITVGIFVTDTSSDANSEAATLHNATLSVKFTTRTCVYGDPTIVVETNMPQEAVLPFEPVSGTVKITNNDVGLCASRSVSVIVKTATKTTIAKSNTQSTSLGPGKSKVLTITAHDKREVKEVDDDDDSDNDERDVQTVQHGVREPISTSQNSVFSSEPEGTSYPSESTFSETSGNSETPSSSSFTENSFPSSDSFWKSEYWSSNEQSESDPASSSSVSPSGETSFLSESSSSSDPENSNLSSEESSENTSDPFSEMPSSGFSSSDSSSSSSSSLSSSSSSSSTSLPLSSSSSSGFEGEEIVIDVSAKFSVKGDTRETPTVSLTYRLVETCALRVPTITATPLDRILPYGAEQEFSIELNITSTDAVRPSACMRRLTRYDMSGSVPGGFSGKISPGAFFLSPGASITATASLTTEKNLAGGNYSVSFGVQAPSRVHAKISVKSEVRLQCPDTPEAPRELTSTQENDMIATKTKARISWRACDVAAACCCPCTYVVYRDGKQIGITRERSLVDENTLSVGQTYRYRVETIDVYGNVSVHSCMSELTIVGEEADKKMFFVVLFCCLAVGIALLLLIATLIWAYHDKCARALKLGKYKQPFMFTDDDEGSDLDVFAGTNDYDERSF